MLPSQGNSYAARIGRADLAAKVHFLRPHAKTARRDHRTAEPLCLQPDRRITQ